jgi:hypothetical protein
MIDVSIKPKSWSVLISQGQSGELAVRKAMVHLLSFPQLVVEAAQSDIGLSVFELSLGRKIAQQMWQQLHQCSYIVPV